MTSLRTRSTSERTTGLILVAVAGLLWSTIGLGVRSMEAASPAQIVFHRATAQIPVILLLIAVRHRRDLVRRMGAIGWSGVLGALSLALSYLTGMYAFATTSVANAAFMISVAPLLAGLLGWLLLRETIRPTTWAAMALALVGVVVMTATASGSGNAAGNLAALGSAATYALFTVILRRNRGVDMLPMVALSGVFAMGLGALAADGLAVTEHDRVLSWLLGSVALAFGLTLYTAGSKYLTSAELPLVAMTETVLAPVWVWIAIGEAITPSAALGGLVILAAVVIQGWFGVPRMRLPRGYMP